MRGSSSQAGLTGHIPAEGNARPTSDRIPLGLSSPDAMNGQSLQRTVVIANSLGFHMRPQKAFAELAQRFESTITLGKGDRRVNGKSPFELLLMSVPQGTDLVIEATGTDAQSALDALEDLLTNTQWDDEDDSAAPLPPKG